MSFELVEDDAAVNADLLARFDADNPRRGPWDRTTFSLVRRDDGSRVTAGVRGILNMGAVEIRTLWVDEGLRGQGIGAALLAAVEAEAKRRGATRARLDTYDWQAQPFYESRGYRPFAAFDFPAGARQVWLEKEL